MMRSTSNRQCLVCNRGGAESTVLRTEFAEGGGVDSQVTADLCPECADDRHRVVEALKRVAGGACEEGW